MPRDWVEDCDMGCELSVFSFGVLVHACKGRGSTWDGSFCAGVTQAVPGAARGSFVPASFQHWCGGQWLGTARVRRSKIRDNGCSELGSKDYGV
jgi:hypothetical protein